MLTNHPWTPLDLKCHTHDIRYQTPLDMKCHTCDIRYQAPLLSSHALKWLGSLGISYRISPNSVTTETNHLNHLPNWYYHYVVVHTTQSTTTSQWSRKLVKMVLALQSVWPDVRTSGTERSQWWLVREERLHAQPRTSIRADDDSILHSYFNS